MATKKLLLQEDDPLELVVSEEADDLRPHRVGIITVANNSVKDVLGHGEEEPSDDGGVDRQPVGVTVQEEEVGGAIDVVLQVILTKEEIEVCLPSIKIRLVVGEDDRTRRSMGTSRM